MSGPVASAVLAVMGGYPQGQGVSLTELADRVVEQMTPVDTRPERRAMEGVRAAISRLVESGKLEGCDDHGVTWLRLPRAWPLLTRRERQVARELCTGRERSEIALSLGISPKTVDTHRMEVMRKLGVRNEVRLLRLAVVRGWITIDLDSIGEGEGGS